MRLPPDQTHPRMRPTAVSRLKRAPTARQLERALFDEALDALAAGFAELPSGEAALPSERLREALLAAAGRLHDSAPYHHPFYLGQMQKPPHPVARLAYGLALELNPNNHGRDGGRASVAMEAEAVAQLAALFGWRAHRGHLCGGGTVAHLEALWIAREHGHRAGIAASAQAHYCHARAAGLLGLPYHPVAVDARGRLDLGALERMLAAGTVDTVIATLGTTATGAVDPLAEIVALRRRHRFRLHVDASYGGYFGLAGNLDADTRRAFEAAGAADSIVVDPHKHGLQPYGCGCVLFRDAAVPAAYRHASPYFRPDDDAAPAPGAHALECSRPGAAAVALWTTLRLLPLVPGGAFAEGLAAGRAAALSLHAALENDARCAPLAPPQLDVVVWAMRAGSAREASARARAVLQAAQAHDLHLSLTELPRALLEPHAPVRVWDADTLVCLRACLMKPEHGPWLDAILERLAMAIREACG